MKTPLTKVAKLLRKNSTIGERILWFHLRNRKVDGIKFKRQHPIGRYVADFVCTDKKIVVEVDGSSHFNDKVKERDMKRQDWLEQNGYVVLRFWDHQVTKNVLGVLESIRQQCNATPSRKSLPPREGSKKVDQS